MDITAADALCWLKYRKKIEVINSIKARRNSNI